MKDVNVNETVVRYSSAGGVVIHDGRMLLLNRPGRGEIRLPKGHIEPGETAEATALRETAEEAGYAELTIVADLGEHVVRFEYEGETFIRNEHYFLMRMDGDGRHPRSAKDAAQFVAIWVALDEAADRLTYAAEQAVARRAVEVHRAGGDVAPAV